MLLGLPMGHDEVQFNIHKIYGPLQMSHMLANWEQINATDGMFPQDFNWRFTNCGISRGAPSAK